MEKVLLLGNRVARYHSSTGVEKRLREILADREIDYSESLDSLEAGNLACYRLVISYLEFSDQVMTDSQTAALISFVANGGALLVLHNGISLQKRAEFAQLVAARFTGHPDYVNLPQIDYKVVARDHPIMAGLRDFTMGDEPYRFITSPLSDATPLLEYEYEGVRWPAGWARLFALGKVVYFSNGHNELGFDDPSMRLMLRNAVEWLEK